MTHASHAGHFHIQLLLADAAPLPIEAFLATLQKLAPSLTSKMALTGDLQLNDAATGAQIDLAPVTAVVELEAWSAAASQTWDWPEAERIPPSTRGTLVLTDHSLATEERLSRLQRTCIVVRAAMEHMPVIAIHWEPAQRLIDPHVFAQSLAHGSSVIDHAVNVRLFRISDGRPGEMLMDTLGLAPFGLRDLQCHFAGADPGQMGPVLASYAEYLFDRGDVLNDDSLVRGIESHHEWACHLDESLAPPARPVVDIRPDDLWVPA